MTYKAISGTDFRKNDRLLPCPFCGKDAMVVRNVLDGSDAYHIECTGCLAEHARYMGSREAAIEAWNTRAERKCRYVKDPDTWAELCSECGALAIEDWTADYCWACGAKVVGS